MKNSAPLRGNNTKLAVVSFLQDRLPIFTESSLPLQRSQVARTVVNGCRNPRKDGAAKKAGMAFARLQPLLAIERLVANEGWVASPVKAVSRRRRGPQARLYRALATRPYSATEVDGWSPGGCFSAFFARIHAAGNNCRMRLALGKPFHA
jgi:hypothetical protein